MNTTLEHLLQHKALTEGDATRLVVDIGTGAHNPSHLASFLTAFIMRNITMEELRGFRDGMLQLANLVDLSEFNPMDVCGTGGDGRNTFNVSTTVAFVVAGAGIPVAKHGNYGVSSVSGSSNVLESLGIRFHTRPDTLRSHLEAAGICFLHAPLFHPAMRHVAPVRKELGIKTFFNMLGPLVNPARPKVQFTGVFSFELARLYQYLFQEEDVAFSIVHDFDGSDELSLTGSTKCITGEGEILLTPGDFGFEPIDPAELSGGRTVADAASIFMNILQGNGTVAQNAVVLANSAVAIKTYRPSLSLEAAVETARESLIGRKALQSFQTLQNLS